MAEATRTDPQRLPVILPLGDSAILVRFADSLSERANRQAIDFARRLDAARPRGVLEIVPSLASVLVTYAPRAIDFAALSGQLRLVLSVTGQPPDDARAATTIMVRFGGADGPDLESAAMALKLPPATLIAAHNAAPLRVLASGFAPGFVYCGFHGDALVLPRRRAVRARVEPGSILFAAGQTAIAATPVPTGWHVIGRTDFANFDAGAYPPTLLRAGDSVRFEAAHER